MIETTIATIYYAPTAKRRYITKRAAIRAEAAARIKRKYPTEPYEDGTGHSFHWRDLENSEKLFRRMCRMISMSCNTNSQRHRKAGQ